MSVSVPKTMRALTEDDGHKVSVKEINVPELNDNEVLVKVHYAAQNPTDWKHVQYFTPKDAIIGCDFSGEIVKLGSNLKNTSHKVGDKVSGVTHGSLYDDRGAFAEYTKVYSQLVFNVPDNLSMEEAASFGIPWGTTLQAMVLSQKHEWPPATVSGDKWYLIYGASSSVGLFAVQFAKVLGYKTVAVCSPHNFDLVKSYGADEVVDYHNEEECIEQIKKITNGGVKIGMDTISEGKSFEISCKSFAEGGGRLNAILWPTDEQRIRKDVEIETTLMYSFFGKAFTSLGRDWPAVPEDEAFAADAWARSADLIKKYNIRANPVDHRNGLDAIPEGLEHMKQGKVSGKKLIYKIAQ